MASAVRCVGSCWWLYICVCLNMLMIVFLSLVIFDGDVDDIHLFIIVIIFVRIIILKHHHHPPDTQNMNTIFFNFPLCHRLCHPLIPCECNPRWSSVLKPEKYGEKRLFEFNYNFFFRSPLARTLRQNRVGGWKIIICCNFLFARFFSP